MALKYKSTQVYLKPDPRYKSMLAAKFINCIMSGGKKSIAQRIFYDAMEVLRERFPEKEPVEVLEGAVSNVRPMVEVRSKRVGGMTYQVPVEVKPKRQQSLALRWILNSTRSRKGKPMYQILGDELSDAYRKQGAAYTLRENVHKMAEANKAFAHFAW
jgi:small subunit ribosomal protein S7